MEDRQPQFRFQTLWSLDASIDQVWCALTSPAEWPRWWPGCLIVEPLDTEARHGLGTRYRFYWEGSLPYRLVIEMRITALEAQRLMVGCVDGPLAGSAQWTLWEEANATRVAFELAVSGRKPWMRYVAPAARPLFRWNHERLMADGERGLRPWLDSQRRAKSRALQAGFG